MSKYKLDVGWCGDDYCNCHYFRVYKDGKKIYESPWMDVRDWDTISIQEERDELNKLNLKFDTSGDSIWDWDEQEYED